MPPLPASPIFGATVDGYHAALVLADIAPPERFFEPPTSLEIQALWEAWTAVYRAVGGVIGHLLASRANARLRHYPRHTELVGTLRHLSKHCEPLDRYIQPGMTTLELLDLIPPLEEAIKRLLKNPPFQPFGQVDARVLAMARWFKKDFMKWADPIKCHVCGSDTRPGPGSEPTPKERSDGAGRVETHICKSATCGATTRFPRYGHVRTLTRTRSGRCGEWAHLFYAFLRASGIDARYVWNSEDHVWTEYWSDEVGHWVHVDSCEAATNKPLLYALGWGKKQSFCLAFGPYGAEDVSRAYVEDWTACLQRRGRRNHGWSDYALRLGLLQQTLRCRRNLSPEMLEMLAERDGKQKAWMEDDALRIAEAEKDELGGRTSGTADWRAARQELGLPKLVRPSFISKRNLVDSWTLRGQARRQGNTTLLTDGSGQTSGTFSINNISQSTSFRISMRFKLDSTSGGGEADGIAVVLSSSKELGVPGYGLGYSEMGGPGDFAVEIDTYRSRDPADDPPTPHISLHSPPHAFHEYSLACTPKDGIPFLSDGKENTLELIYHSEKREVTAYLITAESEEIGLWQAKVPAGEGRDWYVGVTGACGGLWQRQEILSITVEEIDFAVK